MEDAEDDVLGPELARAETASRLQAAALGLDWEEPVPLAGYRTPSEALTELADRHDRELSGATLARVKALDSLDEPTATTLARFVDAYLALDTATQRAYEDADADALRAEHAALKPAVLDAASGGTTEAPTPGSGLRDAGVDLSTILSTRVQFLHASVALHRALGSRAVATVPCDPVAVAPAFSISLAGCDDTYDTDVALSVDAGGDDTYLNNAGGASLTGGACAPLDPRQSTSAALVDVHGDDVYGDVDDPRSCGANGGGALGAGLLLDAHGDDNYTAANEGTNGGGALGAGLLLDAHGDDNYTAGNEGTNGGGVFGAGLLLDSSGDDVRTAGSFGTNGGSALGVGLLLDASGDDAYTADESGTNGGGALGPGFLLDLRGDDTYVAGDQGANGGGSLGAGLLLDAAGFDRYLDASTDCTDCTVVPKGSAGAQVDSDDPPATP